MISSLEVKLKTILCAEESLNSSLISMYLVAILATFQFVDYFLDGQKYKQMKETARQK